MRPSSSVIQVFVSAVGVIRLMYEERAEYETACETSTHHQASDQGR